MKKGWRWKGWKWKKRKEEWKGEEHNGMLSACLIWRRDLEYCSGEWREKGEERKESGEKQKGLRGSV